MVRLARLTFAVLAVLSVGVSAFAGCLPGGPTAHEQMACCQKGQHDCGTAMRAADCCKSTTQTSEQLVATKPVASVKPAVTLSFMAVITAPAQPMVSAGARAFILSSGASPLPFLLSSTLRI
jgi:hypothetical protein